MVQQTSESEITQNNSQQKTVFYAKDIIQSMEWTEEQQEILQDQLEEQVANEEYYRTLDEPH